MTGPIPGSGNRGDLLATSSFGGEMLDPSAFTPPSFSDQPPLLPTDIAAPERKVSAKFQKEAGDYVARWCRESRAFVKRKLPAIKKAMDDYRGLLTSEQFAESDNLYGGREISKARQQTKDPKRWHSTFLYPITHAVSAFSANAYNSFFGGSEWFVVLTNNDNPTDEATQPTAQKIGKLLEWRLKQGKIHNSLYQALCRLVVQKAVPAKVFWSTQRRLVRKLDLATMEYFYDEQIIREFPVLQLIELDKWLPDWKAENEDVQRWRGVGHIVARTYEEILAEFTRGSYNLNFAEFKRQFKNAGSNDDPDSVNYDADAAQSTEFGRLWLWEWHGAVPFENRFVECCATFVTAVSADSPESGLLIRLTNEPILDCGLRPFVLGHWDCDPPGAFGSSLIEKSNRIRYLTSALIGQLSDLSKSSCHGSFIAREGSGIGRALARDNMPQPGKVYQTGNPQTDLIGFPQNNAPAQQLVELTGMFQTLWQEVTNITDQVTGTKSPGSMTAMQSHILDARSQGPFQAVTHRFSQAFVEPALNLQLALMQQHTFKDQNVPIVTDTGEVRALTVTADELRNGDYDVVTVMANQDSSSIAKINAFQGLLQMVPTLQPFVQQEGGFLSVVTLLKRFLDQFKGDGLDRVIRMAGSREQMLQQQVEYLQQLLAQMGGPVGQSGGAPVPNNQPTPSGANGGPMGDVALDPNAMAAKMQEINQPPQVRQP